MPAELDGEPNIPVWLRALDWVRRHNRHHLRSGARIYNWMTPRIARPIVTEIVPDVRLWMDLSQGVERYAWWAGRRYELPTVEIVIEWCNRASHFFDIGANFGFFSYVAHQATEAEVYAFEPNTALVARIERAVRDNGLDRLHPQQIGLGDENGTLEFHLVGDETGHATFGPHPLAHAEQTLVPVRRFDEWRTEHGLDLPTGPSWVAKIDVEGFELRVLRGMQEALEGRAFRGLAVELNDYTLELAGTSSAEVRDELADVGYRQLDVDASRHQNGFFVPG